MTFNKSSKERASFYLISSQLKIAGFPQGGSLTGLCCSKWTPRPAPISLSAQRSFLDTEILGPTPKDRLKIHTATRAPSASHAQAISGAGQRALAHYRPAVERSCTSSSSTTSLSTPSSLSTMTFSTSSWCSCKQIISITYIKVK